MEDRLAQIRDERQSLESTHTSTLTFADPAVADDVLLIFIGFFVTVLLVNGLMVYDALSTFGGW